MSTVRMHVVVEGRVQGVYFRSYTAQEANRLCLTGWVRNLDSGDVEAEFQGDERDVLQIVNWLHQGSPLSRVSLVRTRPCESLATENSFEVRR